MNLKCAWVDWAHRISPIRCTITTEDERAEINFIQQILKYSGTQTKAEKFSLQSFAREW